MYQITTHDATSRTPLFRMTELFSASVAGVRCEGRVNAGLIAARIKGETPVSFKDADLGAPAWSPPA
jgi:hypothetical protein